MGYVCNLRGIISFFASFLHVVSRQLIIKRIILMACLSAAILLIIAQLPPLFWWLFIGGAVFSWTSVIGLTLHLALLLLALWGALASMNTIVSLKSMT